MYKKILAILSSVVLSCSMMPVPVGVTAVENVSTVSGDVNGDGVVNILDTLALKNHIVEGKSVEGYTYDTNGDGTSDRVDVIQSKRSTFGLDNFSYYNDGIYDSFASGADSTTVEDDFEDSIVLVSIKHQYSQVNKVWSAEDLGVDNVDYIEDLTYMHKTQEEIEEYLSLSRIEFRQILCLHLKDTGKEKVLEMVNSVSSNPSIYVQLISVSSLGDYQLD